MRNAVRSGPAYAVMACAFVVLAALVVGILSGVGFGASGPPQASGRGASASSPERAGTTTDAPTGSPPGSSPRELDDRTTQAQRPGPAGTTRPPTASLPSESAGAQRSASANAAFARDFQAAFPDLAPHAGIAITATAGGGGVAAGGSVARGGDSVAYRVVRNELLRQVVEQVGPVIAPSANPESKPPAKNIAEAKAYFGDTVDLYVDGGEVPRTVHASQIVRVKPDGTVDHLR